MPVTRKVAVKSPAPTKATAVARTRSAPSTIDAYVAALRPDQRAAVQRLREVIQAAAPLATECISYAIPAFRLNGKGLIWFGAAAAHSAIYSVSESYPGEFAGYDTSGKGTVRFPLGKALPTAFIRKLVKARIARIARTTSAAASAAAKATASTRPKARG